MEYLPKDTKNTKEYYHPWPLLKGGEILRRKSNVQKMFSHVFLKIHNHLSRICSPPPRRG
jgi:hypothetical protein